MSLLPSQFSPICNSDSARVRFFVFNRLRLPVTLNLVCKRFRGVVYVVVTVVPSLVVLLVPLLKFFWPGGISSVGMTYTGSEADTMETESLLCTMLLRLLNMVVKVVPSFVVVLPPLGKGCPSGRSSEGIMFTGSDAETMEMESLFRATFLRSLNVVVTVVPSLVVVLSSLGTISSIERSSEGMMFTGSDAAMIEIRERPALATGVAKEELMQRRAKTITLDSRGC